MAMIPFSDDADAVKIANDSNYGLGGSVWTADEQRGIDVSRRVRTGTIAGDRGCGHARRPGDAEGRDPRSGVGKEGVCVAVISPGELDDAVAPGHGAREPHRGHRRLSAGGDESHHLHRGHGLHDPLRQLDLELHGMAVRDTSVQLLAERRDHLRRLVTEDVRSVGQDEVDERVAVGVEDVRPLAANDVRRDSGHRAVCADGAVDPTRENALGALAERPSVAVLHCPRSARAP